MRPELAPDVAVAIDRLVLEDLGLDPGRARRLQDAVERHATRLLQGEAAPADEPSDPLVPLIARAIADAVRSRGGPDARA